MNKIAGITSKQQERLEFIEFRLYWEGSINRNSLVEFFEISKPQASVDIKSYQEHVPGNLNYDLSNKCYIKSSKFKPKIYKPNAKRYLSYLDAVNFGYSQKNKIPIGEMPKFDVLPKFHKEVDVKTLQKIIEAIQNKFKIKIAYQALSSPNKTTRWIHPLSLVHTQYRWHLRAYCLLRKEFRSFVLGRIINITASADDENIIPVDEHWNDFIKITFIPNSKLNEAISKIINQEYGMKEGKVSISVRRALLDYFLLDNDFASKFKEREGLKKENDYIAIENFDTLKSELKYLDENA